MKKNILFAIGLVSVILAGCDPVEDRDTLSGGITAEQLNISATPVVRDGANSNYIELNSDGNGCLSSWDYGFGTLVGTKGTVKVMTTGPNEIVYTGLNADGTKITKTLTVNVEKLYDVEPEWALFCGSGEKEWIWDDTQPPANNGSPAVWGNGGIGSNDGPAWWTVGLNEVDGQAPGEGEGASMVFMIKGARLVKHRTDGSTVTGTFSFDMSQPVVYDGKTWAIGQLNTKGIAVLGSKVFNSPITECTNYQILQLNENQMALAAPKENLNQWEEATFWKFRAK